MATGQRRALAVTLGHNHRGLDTEPSPSSGHHHPAKSGIYLHYLHIAIVKQKYLYSQSFFSFLISKSKADLDSVSKT